MKIAHVAWGHYPANRGCGPVIYLHALARAQCAAGDDVTIVCSSDRALPGRPAFATESEIVEGIVYVHVCNRPVVMHDLWNPLREARNVECEAAFDVLLGELAPDIVHIHNFIGLSFDIVAVARRHAGAVVNSLHNYVPVCSRDDLFFADAERCGGPLERSCSRCLGTLLDDSQYRARNAAGIQALNDCALNLAVSKRTAEIYIEQGVNPERLVVERCGSSTAERLWRQLGAGRVALAAAGAELPIGDRPLRLVFFGAVSAPRKGAMVLLQALPLLRDPTRVDVRIYGGLGAPDVERITGLMQTWSPAARGAVTFAGPFTQDHLVGMLSQVDAAVLTPRWEDTGPQTVFESQGAGLPLIATRVGGIPDVIEDGRNGLLVHEGAVGDLAVAIDRLIDEPQLLARLRSGIRPPRRTSGHARSLRNYYARALGCAEEPQLVHTCAVAHELASAVGAAYKHAGRRDVVIELGDAADEATRSLAASLYGDITVRWPTGAPPELPRPPSQPYPVSPTGWLVRWPQDAEALVDALALAAAFPDRVPSLEIGIAGDLEQTVREALAALAGYGISDGDLPDVGLRAAHEGDGRSIEKFVDLLAEEPTLDGPVWVGDENGVDAPLRAVLSGLVTRRPRAIVSEEFEGITELAAGGPLTLICGGQIVRDCAGTSVTVLARELVATDGQGLDIVVVDGRRPHDLRLVSSLDASILIVHSGGLSTRALAAFGLEPVGPALENGIREARASVSQPAYHGEWQIGRGKWYSYWCEW